MGKLTVAISIAIAIIIACVPSLAVFIFARLIDIGFIWLIANGVSVLLFKKTIRKLLQ